MIKLVVNRDHGEQELLVIHESGGYHDPTKVVWDERVDGPLAANHEAAIGGLVRSGKTISIDNAKLATARAAKQAKDTAESEKFSAPAALRAAIQGVDFNNPVPAQKVSEILKHVVRLLT